MVERPTDDGAPGGSNPAAQEGHILELVGSN